MNRQQKTKLPHEGVYARIMPSKIHGVGVFAIRDIPKGTRLFDKDDSELVWMKKSDLDLAELPRGIRQLYDQFCIIKDKGQTYGCPRSFNLMTVALQLKPLGDPQRRLRWGLRILRAPGHRRRRGIDGRLPRVQPFRQ